MPQTPNVGELGEQLVAEWLQTQNWVILHHRWRCRWGEIDLIACSGARDRGGESRGSTGSHTIAERDDSVAGRSPVRRSTTSFGKQGESFLPISGRETASPHQGSGASPASPASPLLAFVEVKTRSNRNWDADGRLAITPQKQAKLLQAAQLFLAEHPDFANLPCRFDVALVSCQRISQRSQRDRTDLSPSPVVSGKATQVSPIQLGQPIFRAGYRLILQDYIQSAFE